VPLGETMSMAYPDAVPIPRFKPSPGIKLVYTDLDGTMLGRAGAFIRDAEGNISLEPAKALARVLDAGIEVVPCSGRVVQGGRGLIGDARILGLSSVIGEMGAVIAYEYGAEIIRNLGAYPGGEELPVVFMERAGAVRVLFERFRLEYHAPWHAYREYTHLLRGLIDFDDVNAFLTKAGYDWLEIQDNGRLNGAYMGLPAGACHVYHLLPRGVSKGSAVALDRQRRGLEREECVFIGDAAADLTAASHVGAVVLTIDSVEGDPALSAAARSTPNASVTEKPGNLGWAAALSSIARRR
jgi:hydroxymethylpyrimidine pyrophosphatase-like HAD family hydrolase